MTFEEASAFPVMPSGKPFAECGEAEQRSFVRWSEGLTDIERRCLGDYFSRFREAAEVRFVHIYADSPGELKGSRH